MWLRLCIRVFGTCILCAAVAQHEVRTSELCGIPFSIYRGKTLQELQLYISQAFLGVDITTAISSKVIVLVLGGTPKPFLWSMPSLSSMSRITRVASMSRCL